MMLSVEWEEFFHVDMSCAMLTCHQDYRGKFWPILFTSIDLAF